jgi:hypothetical protein
MAWAGRGLNLRQFFLHVPSEHTVHVATVILTENDSNDSKISM